MSRIVDPNLLVPRTCLAHDEKTNTRERRPLAAYRSVPAYVLLGDPGAGKTESFKQEAAATGGHYVRARSFATLDPSSDLAGKTLFIDGLDEMRAGGSDGRTPLDHVRRHLNRLGHPHFRLSCREADWYGDSDSAALTEVSPEGALAVLHLDPLSDSDIALLLERKFGIADPASFIEQADRHSLADLLRNPQTLRLLANAVGGEAWPDSRATTYDLACRQLAREINQEHRNAKRFSAPTTDALLDAAGFLCAVHLLAGISGFALDDDAEDAQHALWRNLSSPRELPLLTALASGLFQRGDREQQRIPVHRSIAEFLGGRCLSVLIESYGLPIGRIVALMAGNDGGIVPDLRGLAAWFAAHCRSARSELTARDPLGIVLYGDVHSFPLDDKRRLMAALQNEAERNARFRLQDWTTVPFGALSTPDMVPLFLELLASPSRSEPHIALLDCALDALRHGQPLAKLSRDQTQLEELLDVAMRDANYPAHIRHSALGILLRDLPRNAARLVMLAKDIHAGTVRDADDQLLGSLLTELFPEHIHPTEVFDFLHPEKDDHLIGEYHTFWGHHLPDAPDALLPELLDQLEQHRGTLSKSLDDNRVERMAGRILARALEVHGDTIDNVRLYAWLGAGLDEYGHPRTDREHQERIAAWLSARPERFKAVLIIAAERCIGNESVWTCLFNCTSRLYYAEPPGDIVPWYLDRAAAEIHPDFREFYFSLALRQLVREGGQEWLTLGALDSLAPWANAHPDFERHLEAFVSCGVNDWRRDDAARRRKWDDEREKRRNDWQRHFRNYVEAIREGSAPPQVLDQLAQPYLRKFIDIRGETPQERLADFLGNDAELIAAAYAGFRRSLDRTDLPSVAEIVDLEMRGRMHFIRQPCLAGMDELYTADHRAALQLDDEVLRKLLAFRLTWVAEREAEWFTALVKLRPDLTAEVLVAYARPLLSKGREHVRGIWQLAYDNDFTAVARAALPSLLKDFPPRAKNGLLANSLDPLLKAALRHLDRPVLLDIVSTRLAQQAMTTAQRVYWLACGLLVSPAQYEAPLAEYIGKNRRLCIHLGAFLQDRERRPSDLYAPLPESSLALLIQLLAPDCTPDRAMGGMRRVSASMHTAEGVRSFIDMLGRNPSEAATNELSRLSALTRLAPWHDYLRQSAQSQRIARRKSEFRPADLKEICGTLANLAPANVADLAALAFEHLRDLSSKIRDGSTNDYRQYWSYDKRGKPERTKPENDCRDILLSDLAERLARLGVDAIKEGYYAEDKRADIRVSFGGPSGFNVPIEIKKDSHGDLWRAMRTQLIEGYARHPGADGFGIYLVFWFGGVSMPTHPKGKPANAAQLEDLLRSELAPEESLRIQICVVDCALPGN